MPHALLLFPQLPSETYLSDLVAEDKLRASALIDFGPYAGVAMAYSESVQGLSQTRSMVCPGDPGCVGGLLVPLPKVPNVNEPGAFNAYGLLRLDPGERRRWATHTLRGIDRAPGAGASAAHVLGLDDVDALVAVSGEDLDEVSERLFELIDVPFVAVARSAVISPENAAGWGSELARLP